MRPICRVSADLENGFGDAPEECVKTIHLAAQAGVVGGSIEDATGRADEPIYPFEAAVERVRAAVEAARAQPFPFTLTARAENYLCGRPDLDDTIRRLLAYQEAGADVLYAPGLKTREEIAAVVNALERPVNVLMGLQGVLLSVDELQSMGVRRVSVGGSLARAALGAFCAPRMRFATRARSITRRTRRAATNSTSPSQPPSESGRRRGDKARVASPTRAQRPGSLRWTARRPRIHPAGTRREVARACDFPGEPVV